MSRVSFDHVVKSSIISAFTIAAALIWKDVIIEAINLIVPPQSQLLYKFLVAIIATIIIGIWLYVFLKTEDEAEGILKKLRKKK